MSFQWTDKRRASVSLLIFVVGAGFLGPAVAAEKSQNAPKRVVVTFDFESKFDKGRYGQMVADAISKRLDRLGDFVLLNRQDVRDLCESNGLRITPDTPLEKVRDAVRKDFDAQVGIWGSIERAPGTDGEIYDLVLKCFDFSGDEPQAIYEKSGVRTNSVSEVPHVYVKEMLEKLSGRTIATPQTKRTYANDPKAIERWKTGPNLIPGGDFETAARGVPKSWEPRAGQLREPLGNLVKWMPEKENPSNHVIHFDMPQIVGDNEGIMYYSNSFPVQEGAVYRFQCRWRSSGPTVKVIIKCSDVVETVYRREKPDADEGDSGTGSQNAQSGREKREGYRAQMQPKGPSNTWNTHTEDFTPKHTKFSPKWGRVMLYAYLGAGTIEFDDVVVKQIVPPPSHNLVKDRRHSSASKVTLKEMEENERRGKEAREQLRKEKEEEAKED